MIFGIGGWIAERWTPANLIFDEWANFLDMSLVILLITVLAVFVFYRVRFYRAIKITHWNTVFRIRRPWFVALAAIPVGQLVLTSALSFAALSGLTLPAVIGAVLVSVLEGIVGAM